MSGLAFERMQESFQRTLDSACAEYGYLAHRVCSYLGIAILLSRLCAFIPLSGQFPRAGGSSVKP
jgi:hypothetical protein